MEIAILGGSFDPPHKGHTAIANRLLKLFHFDEIWLMPCYQHPFNKKLSAFNKRLAMTKHLEKDNVKVSDLEIRKKGISFTVDTLKFLNKTHPQDNFSWIIGNDQIKNFTKWKKWKEIISNFKLIIVPRSGSDEDESGLKNIKKKVTNLKNIVLIDGKKFPPISTSSTLIREGIKNNKSISGMVPKGVEEYIIEHNLYLN